MVFNDYLPYALSIGVSYELFWSLNPRKLQPFVDAFKMKCDKDKEMVNVTAYINGLYVARAIACTFGNSKYPEEPLDIFVEHRELTEEEIQKQTEAFFMSLSIMEANFNNSKKEKGKD